MDQIPVFNFWVGEALICSFVSRQNNRDRQVKDTEETWVTGGDMELTEQSEPAEHWCDG